MVRILALLGVCLIWSAAAQAQQLTIIHIDIGQGDSTLILGPRDSAGGRVSVLVDAGDITFQGDPDGGAVVLNELLARGLTSLDFFVVSHYDADHVGGAITGANHIHGSSFVLGADGVPGSVGDDDGDGDTDWLDTSQTQPDPDELGLGDDIDIGTFVDRGDASNSGTATYNKYVEIANAMGQRRSLATQFDVDTFEIDLGGGATMFALSANGLVRNRAAAVPNVNTENERSLSFLVTFDDFHYLISGDLIGRAAGSENAMVELAVGEFLEGAGINVDVLHVNHHGANNGSEATFLTRIAPEVAIISLGNDNGHGHPHADALIRLEAAGVQAIYQTNWGSTAGAITDEVRRIQAIAQGNIVLTTDGDSYEISTSRSFQADD